MAYRGPARHRTTMAKGTTMAKAKLRRLPLSRSVLALSLGETFAFRLGEFLELLFGHGVRHLA
jgi:hypothetical protein